MGSGRDKRKKNKPREAGVGASKTVCVYCQLSGVSSRSAVLVVLHLTLHLAHPVQAAKTEKSEEKRLRRLEKARLPPREPPPRHPVSPTAASLAGGGRHRRHPSAAGAAGCGSHRGDGAPAALPPLSPPRPRASPPGYLRIAGGGRLPAAQRSLQRKPYRQPGASQL